MFLECEDILFVISWLVGKDCVIDLRFWDIVVDCCKERFLVIRLFVIVVNVSLVFVFFCDVCWNVCLSFVVWVVRLVGRFFLMLFFGFWCWRELVEGVECYCCVFIFLEVKVDLEFDVGMKFIIFWEVIKVENLWVVVFDVNVGRLL